MLQYITQVYIVHVEYRQKVNRCGLHTERNGMKTPVAKYFVGADERICQDLWRWSIQYTFSKDKHVYLHFLLSLTPSEIKMTQCICRGQKCILSAWDCTIVGSALSAGIPVITLQPSNSDLSVLALLHSPLLIFYHKKAPWRHWKFLSCVRDYSTCTH